MGLHISDIQKNYNDGKYSISYYSEFQELLNLTKLSKDHVFDENLSVKRNREMVEEHNDKIEQLRKAKREKQADLDRQLTEDVVTYLTESYNLTSAQARLVELLAYNEKHHCMHDYFIFVDSLGEFADDLLTISKGGE
jgi:5'(3')-deoxyribonucleotidase